MGLIDYAQAGGTIVDIDLDAPAIERWAKSAAHIGEKLHALMDDVLAYFSESLTILPARIRPLALAAISGSSGWSVGTIARLYRPDYEREIAGIAKAADVSYPRVLLANLMYDLTHLWTWSAGIATKARSRFGYCSSYSCELPSRTPVLVRNMDWDIPESCGRHTVVYRFHRGKHEYLSVGIAGLVGVLSAMRPGHWAVTLNMAPTEHLPFNWLQWPVTQRLRAVCDQFGSYRSVLSRLQAYQTMSPFFAHVVGVRPGEQSVINGFGQEYSRRSDKRALIQTNHFVDEGWEAYNTPESWEDATGQTWICDSRPRYRALERRLVRRPRSLPAALQNASPARNARGDHAIDGLASRIRQVAASGTYLKCPIGGRGAL